MERLTKSEIQEISRITLEYYERSASGFWEGTRDHDVSQNIEALLEVIPGAADAAIAAELRGLGVRRRPPLGFLRRQNPLNRWMGRVLRRARVEPDLSELGAFG